MIVNALKMQPGQTLASQSSGVGCGDLLHPLIAGSCRDPEIPKTPWTRKRRVGGARRVNVGTEAPRQSAGGTEGKQQPISRIKVTHNTERQCSWQIRTVGSRMKKTGTWEVQVPGPTTSVPSGAVCSPSCIVPPSDPVVLPENVTADTVEHWMEPVRVQVSARAPPGTRGAALSHRQHAPRSHSEAFGASFLKANNDMGCS